MKKLTMTLSLREHFTEDFLIACNDEGFSAGEISSISLRKFAVPDENIEEAQQTIFEFICQRESLGDLE